MKSVDPYLKSAWFQPLHLKCDFLVSNFAFKCNLLSHYILGPLALTHLASTLTNLAECSYQSESFEDALDQSRRAEAAAASASANHVVDSVFSSQAPRRIPLWMDPKEAPDVDEWRDSVVGGLYTC